ncbi:16S rRNA (cytidine(1402)-2'-O)-methyltransferase [Patescibacteria group bacterium]|nr:16S rRNA (cytidine(1402)-2'-O)-methyltransferase [Patescibacteria group bacterium]
MGKLSVIATPIGNLEDMTLRAIRILGECDAVLCEDTRVTAKLLQKYEVKKPMISYHAHSKLTKNERIMELLEQGKHLALVSDAGTPAISDPGAHLVSLIREQLPDTKIEAIAGPSSLTAALSVAGIHADQFLFLGFLPHKKGRQKALDQAVASKHTVVFFESPHRILKLLEELRARVPERHIAVVQELTKLFETTTSGTVADVSERFQSGDVPAKGEFVVVLSA